VFSGSYFLSAIYHCLGRSQPSNVSFLRTIEYFGLFVSESFVVCFSVNLFVVDDSHLVSSVDHT
jgi:hypothetical protein